MHKNVSRKQLYRLYSLLLCCVWALCALIPTITAAAEKELRTVRVGYVNVKGYEEGGEGEYKTGFGYEYLQKIAYHTGWKYEYVHGTLSTLIPMLIEGKIDLLGNITPTEARKQVMNFSAYPQGSEGFYVFAKLKRTDIVGQRLEALQGKRIGVGKNTYQSKLMDEFFAKHNIKVEKIELNGTKGIVKALEAGEIDAGIMTDATDYGYAPAHNIGFSDYNFAVTKSKPELLTELNEALYEIQTADPSYNYTVSKKYAFGTVSINYLTDKEKGWLASHNNTIRFGYLKDNAPYSYVDRDGQLQGALRVIANKLRDKFDIKIETRGYISQSELKNDYAKGKLDVVGPLFGDYFLTEKLDLVQSEALATTVPVLVFKDKLKTDRIAVTDRTIFSDLQVKLLYPKAQVNTYNSIDACLQAVLQGHADCTIISHSALNDLHKNELMETLSFSELLRDAELCMFNAKSNTELLTIINKAVYLSTKELKGAYFISDGNGNIPQLTWKSFVKAHGMALVTIGALIISFLGLLLVMINKEKQKAVKAMQELGDQDQILTQLQQEMKSGVWQHDYDSKGNVTKVSFSKEYREILALEDESIFANTFEAWFSRIHPDDMTECFNRYNAALADETGKTSYDSLYRFRNGADNYRWVRSIGRIVRHKNGTSSLIGYSVDQTDEFNRDNITGSINRNGFVAFVEDYLSKEASKAGYSLLYFNIRSFKALNELWGFDEGDKFIKYYYSQLVNSALNPIKVGRRGDHFFCLVKWQDSLLEEIEKLCSVNYSVDKSVIAMRSRCGIYHITESRSLNTAGMLDRAKLAKEGITDQFVKPYAIFDETLKKHYVDMAFAAAEVNTAIADNQFKTYYQPIVETATGKIVSAEALVRWEHPERGLISPGIFIPSFEEEGLITLVDQSIVRQVGALYKRRLKANAPLVPVSVNLSWMDFYDDKFMERFLADVDENQYPEGLLRAEVTESSYTALSQNVSDLLGHFKARKVTLLLDDFGTGVSSLDMLQQYSFDILKIDMSFTQKLGKNLKTNSLIQAIIDMCHQMGIKVIAEGVETIEQLDFYRENNCDYIQGYYFYKPMPEEEFVALLDKQASLSALVDFRKPKDLLETSYYKAYLYFPNKEMRASCNLATDSILQMIGANSGVGAVSGLYDEQYSICFFSNLTAEFLGYTNQELLEKAAGSYLNLVAPEDRERFCNDEGMERYYSLIDCSGKLCPVKELRTNVRTAKGEKQWVASIKKLEQLSEAEMLRMAQMSKIQDMDSFTHLLTKNAFFRKMDLLLCNEPELPCTLMVMDLDNFKSVNDVCGHMTGDKVLLKVTEILTKVFRSNDLIGRFGGDEFMILMRGTNDKELAKKRAAHINEQIAKEIYYPKLQRPCTISIGIKCSEGASTRSELFNQADAALYKAKNEGRNTFRLSE